MTVLAMKCHRDCKDWSDSRDRPRRSPAGPAQRARQARAFTLIELVAVVVIIGTLAGISAPKYFDHSVRAKDSADQAAIAGISTALKMAYMHHRMTEAPAGQWIDNVDDIPAIMNHGLLPDGIVINGAKLQDQRGNTYTLTVETSSAAAAITKD